MRSPRRFRRTALTALSAGVLLAAAGCAEVGDRTAKGTTGTAEAEDVLLQPLASPGPGPFTASTARAPASPAPSATPDSAPPSATRTVHRVSGAAPGLYGGIRSVAACDVERQTELLTGDKGKGRAFAEASGIEAVQIPGYLKSLTPVVLSVDAQVTNHGYGAGEATAFQAVLQAGTAVLVDGRGMPRVRCACGNPLGPPEAVDGKAAHRGERWPGYDPARIAAVEPGAKAATSLIIVDTDDNTWIQRTVGDSGGRDRTPDEPPPFEPDAELLFPSPGRPTESAPPESAPSDPAPSAPEESTDPGPGESADDFGDPPPDEPWEYEEGEPDVVPEPTQVLPAEPDEPAGPEEEPMEADLGNVFTG
ncbi:DUF6777 domain-containing protein [Streptomyces sp. NPDC059698]|uniref:DUF6777 domain-containing protein n=1 Tax=unclassified Streptomyces TaxID=2593676 RepID=UPI00093E869B|nr:DUF6777 domain-containing protein [Streptomyces sp. CB02366]OKJ34377.1 hypothetical protein AMK24_22865 [Streptomyces sp. CB02366]